MKKIVLSLILACSLGAQAQFSILNGNAADAVFSGATQVKVEEGNSFPSYIELDPQANLSEELFFSIPHLQKYE